MIELQILRDKRGKNLKIVLHRKGVITEPIWGPIHRPNQETVDKIIAMTKSKNSSIAESQPILKSYGNLMITDLKDENIEIGHYVFGKGKETAEVVSR